MESGLILSHHSDTPPSREEELELTQLPYHRLVGLLMYLAIGTHPDIALTVCKLSQFLAFYSHIHWNAAKCILHYLKGTHDLQLWLSGKDLSVLRGFLDASHTCFPDTG
jgi:hypothetical protein